MQPTIENQGKQPANESVLAPIRLDVAPGDTDHRDPALDQVEPGGLLHLVQARTWGQV
jgi:hypothetical protein